MNKIFTCLFTMLALWFTDAVADELYLKTATPEQVDMSAEYALASHDKRAMLTVDGSKIGQVGTGVDWIGDDNGIVIPYDEKQLPSTVGLIKTGENYVVYFKGTETCLGASGNKNNAKLITIGYSENVVNDNRALWQLVALDGELALKSVQVGYHLVYGNGAFKIAAKTSNTQYVNIFQKLGEGIRMPSSEYISYVTQDDIDFTLTPGLTAYQVIAATKSRISIAPIEKAPLSTAVVLHAEKGCYPILQATDIVQPLATNQLRASDGSLSHRSDGGNYYVLDYKLNYGVGFYRVEQYSVVPDRTGYLIIQGDDSNVEFIRLDDTPTGIEVNDQYSRSGSDRQEAMRCYDLMGRPSIKGKKSLIIRQGKKYIEH